MSRPHLADVAREAGVSVGAASLALSGRGRISDSTRQRVREAAARLGYTADPVARAMRVGHLPLVGLVITDLTDPADFELWAGFWSHVLAGLSVAATQRRYGFVLMSELADSELTSLPMAGYAVIGTDVPESDVAAALATGRPVLTDLLDATPEVAVRLDLGYEASLTAALDHLVESGATRPALLGADMSSRWGRALDAARRDWQTSRGIECPVADVAAGGHPGDEAIDRLLAGGADGIATVFSEPDALLTAAGAKGLTVGRDLRMVAIDDDFHGHFARQGISTVAVGLDDVVGRAVDRFVDVVEGLLAPPLTVRSAAVVHARSSTTG